MNAIALRNIQGFVVSFYSERFTDRFLVIKVLMIFVQNAVIHFYDSFGELVQIRLLILTCIIHTVLEIVDTTFDNFGVS
jgi:hypothetical protein